MADAALEGVDRHAVDAELQSTFTAAAALYNAFREPAEELEAALPDRPLGTGDLAAMHAVERERHPPGSPLPRDAQRAFEALAVGVGQPQGEATLVLLRLLVLVEDDRPRPRERRRHHR